MAFDAQQLEQLWVQAGGDPADAAVMAALALQQSGGDPTAVNHSDPNGGSWGLWQINGGNSSILDPLANAKAAVAMFRQDGLSPWSTVNTYDAQGKVTGTTINPIVAAFNAGEDPLTVATTPGIGSQSGYNGYGGQGASIPQSAGQFGVSGQAAPIAGANVHDFHGFDLSAVPEPLLGQAEQNMLQYVQTPGQHEAVMTKIMDDFGMQSWAMAIPQVAGLLVSAAMGGWDKNIFISAIEKTQWWQQTNENQRAWQELQATDPGEARLMLNEASAKLTDTANQLGVTLSGGQLSQMALTLASNTATPKGTFVSPGHYGLTQEQIDIMVSGAYRFSQTTTQHGVAGELMDNFQKLAGQYLVDATPQTVGGWVQNAMNHQYTMQGDFVQGAVAGVEQYLKELSTKLYPTLKGAIDAGITPYQAVDPLRNTIAGTLEIDPSSIDFSNPKWNWVLNSKDPKTGQPLGIMNTDQINQKIMGNPTYGFQHTSNAIDMAYQMIDRLGKSFGVVSNVF